MASVDAVRADGLEVDEDLAFQRRGWLAQRIAWIAILLFVGAAAAGLLGSGPLSRERAVLPGLMSVEYDRFGRLQTPEAVKVRLGRAATGGNAVRLSIDRDFLKSVRIESVLPPPSRVELADGRLIYAFEVGEPGTPMDVTFHIQSEEVGRSEVRVGLESATGRRDVAFRRFVYP